MNTENFTDYLEELAAELRAFTLTKAYLDDVYPTLLDFAKQFYDEAYENASLKGI